MVSEVTSGDGESEETGSELIHPSRNTGQGAILRGKHKQIICVCTGKPNLSQISRRVGVNSAGVTQYMPEAGRSMRGQGEVWGNPHGGLNLR